MAVPLYLKLGVLIFAVVAILFALSRAPDEVMDGYLRLRRGATLTWLATNIIVVVDTKGTTVHSSCRFEQAPSAARIRPIRIDDESRRIVDKETGMLLVWATVDGEEHPDTAGFAWIDENPGAPYVTYAGGVLGGAGAANAYKKETADSLAGTGVSVAPFLPDWLDG